MVSLEFSGIWSIHDYHEAFTRDELSYTDFYSYLIEKISQDHTNSFISRLEEPPREPDDFSNPLAGIPIAIKDNICYSSFPTTCGSKMLKDWVPSYNASIISFLLEKQAVILGKTNLDEFAMGNATSTSYFGKSFNPWDSHKRFSPGGSSGGSAISVALGYTPVGVGSDTGGSVRCPASFTGVLGLKPTYGRVSRYGLISYAHTLDQIGIFGRYAEDVSLLLETISQKDTNDLTYKNQPYSHKQLNLNDKTTVGLVTNTFESIPSPQHVLYMEALAKLEDQGFISIVPITIDDLDILLPTYYVTAFSEAYSNLARYSGQHFGFNAGNIFQTRLEGFGEEVQRRYNLGDYSLKSGYDEQLYAKSQKIRSFYVDKFKSIFDTVEVIASPTMLDVAFSWDEFQSPIDSYRADLLTVPANLTGIPGLSVPCGFVEKQGVKLPVGLQLMSSWWNEKKILQIAYAFQQITDFHLQLPKNNF